ncbi:hypothetical protein C7S20_00130 [Christiangramia fulva]|uniref:asparagine synthase (glutamine-hydrolyzing) n=1 Tax=Christiangramia fulva TaxID=2126553 RepID=A0A2R3Z0M1_9FLAO|nr:hypothetical protein [Christiangramia fulva]AVR43804.1 hypothetical protein C7S20_00130 [Christiangramia fulva]
MKFIFSSQKLDLKKSSDFPNLQKFDLSCGSILLNDPNTKISHNGLTTILDGFLKDFEKKDDLEARISASEYVFETWPVKDTITGSFCSMIISEEKNEITLCSDLVNIYPLYYLKKKEVFFISNSIILLGRYSGAEVDKTGIVQRALGPEFMNIGSRTILKNCKRLLPGEWLHFDLKGNILKRKFDNSLYQNMSGPFFEEGMLEDYWNHYKKETELCTAGFDQVSIALSGGIDSRIALGSVPDSKEIHAYTFGSPENYETGVARKLARIKGAEHFSFSNLSLYFPEKPVLKNYIKTTEAIKLNSWLELLENIQIEVKQPLLLGELCEGLPARNIKKFNSAHFRKKNFIKYYLKKDQFPLSSPNPENFQEWKAKKRQLLVSWFDENWFKRMEMEGFRKEVIKNTLSDIEEIFDRIEAHNLPYAELYDELFSWYTFTRMELSRQVNICNEKFYAFSPGMSIQMLKKTSNIHPNLRLFYRFANKMLKNEPDLRPFRNVPTSQIPLFPQQFPDFLKIPAWGIRSRIDDWLVKRMIKSKDPSKRVKLFPGMNWAKIYQLPDLEERMESYYQPNFLGDEYAKTFIHLTEKRKNFKSWPFANMDIMSGVALNMELELIKKNS